MSGSDSAITFSGKSFWGTFSRFGISSDMTSICACPSPTVIASAPSPGAIDSMTSIGRSTRNLRALDGMGPYALMALARSSDGGSPPGSDGW